MAPYSKKRGKKAKLCTERVQTIEFSAQKREEYLDTLKNRRVLARKKRAEEQEESKRQEKREKRRGRKKKVTEAAEIAQRLIEASGQKEEIETMIGDTIVTIKEM